LGNTKAVIRSNSGVAQLIQERHYYPFGMEMSTLSSETSTNKYLYNGKELENAFDLNWYDYGFRYYDPALARFTTVDPLADEEPSWSPYRYGFNNPIKFIDPNGMLEDWFENELTGNVYYNSSMTKGDENTGAMEGEGWKHMGENGMFGTDDNTVIEENENIATNFKTSGSEFTTEASFKGDNAKTFMKGQGFDFLPTQQIRYESNLTYRIAQNGRQNLSITAGKKIFITEKSSYFKTGSVEKSINPIGKGLIQGGIALKTVNRYQINYSNNKALVGLTKFDSYMQLVYGNRDTRGSLYYDNSSNKYPGNNQLINEFILRNR
jgi:RHS repeat-associated protein